MRRTLCTLLALAGLGSWMGPAVGAGDFTALGDLGGGMSIAHGVSANGAVVIGRSASAAQAERAFRWSGGSMADLGTLGGSYAEAFALSNDGSVVVGASTDGAGALYAFRWVGGAMSSLGLLPGGNYSRAYGVSYDGSVVVGQGGTETSGLFHAFRWTGNTMTDLGTLRSGNGGSSFAAGVSAHGNVVVGHSTAGTGADHAFRWVLGGSDGVSGNPQMRDLGTLGEANAYSSAAAVSADGNVVVGGSGSVAYAYGSHAFRWVAGTMHDLGTLGGSVSNAFATSADGSVVVGGSQVAGGAEQAFRWTQATGMQAVSDWLAAAQIAVPSGWTLEAAKGVDSSGNVLAGYGTGPNGHLQAWLARVGQAGSGLLTDVAAFDASLVQAGTGTVTVITGPMFGMVTSGGHHRSLLDNGLVRSTTDGRCAWVTGDTGYHKASRTRVELLEAGGCTDIGATRLGLGLGEVAGQQAWNLNGSARVRGRYLLAEAAHAYANGLQASILGLHGRYSSDLRRNYQNGAAIDSSTGAPDARTSALRLRVDWKDAGTVGGARLSPYTALTWGRTHLDAYTEAGGGFPAAYQAVRSTVREMRVGATAAAAVSPLSELQFTLEAVHRFDTRSPAVDVQVIGLGGSRQMVGQRVTPTTLRAIMDMDYRLSRTSVLNVAGSVAGRGSDPSWLLSLGYRASF